MTHNGVDLSNHQGQITPQEIAGLKAAGVSFAYVKATQGTDYQNPDAPQQIKALKDAGIAVGLYHFFDVTEPTTQQVQFFLVTAQALGGSDLPLALDSEGTDPSGWQQLAYQMVAFAMQIEAEPNVIRCPVSVFYVNLDFYHSLPGFPWGRLVWLADPNPGAPHEPCLILQSAPRPEGGFSSIDPDVFLGDDTQWAAFLASGLGPGQNVPPSASDGPTGASGSLPPTPPAKEFDLTTLPNITIGQVWPPTIIKAVQALLRDKFDQPQLGVNGNYGEDTIAALKSLQAVFKLPETGEVDQATWEVLLVM